MASVGQCPFIIFVAVRVWDVRPFAPGDRQLKLFLGVQHNFEKVTTFDGLFCGVCGVSWCVYVCTVCVCVCGMYVGMCGLCVVYCMCVWYVWVVCGMCVVCMYAHVAVTIQLGLCV